MELTLDLFGLRTGLKNLNPLTTGGIEPVDCTSSEASETTMPISVMLAIHASIMLVVFAVGLETAREDALFLFRHPPLLLKSPVARNVAMPPGCTLARKSVPSASCCKGRNRVPVRHPGSANPTARSLEGRCARPLCFRITGLTFRIGDRACSCDPRIAEPGFREASSLRTACGGKVCSHFHPGSTRGRYALRHFRPARAGELAHFIGMLGTITLLAALLPLLVVAWQALLVLIGNGGLFVMALFVAAGLAAGHTLGAPNQGDRTALALATASRHPGLAIAIARNNFPDYLTLVAGAVITYLLLSQLFFIPYRRWRRKASDGSVDVTTVPAHV